MSIHPAIFAIVACFLSYRFGKSRRDRGLPVTAWHRIRVGLLVWAFGITALCVNPILAAPGPFPSPGERAAVASAFLLVGWGPLVVGQIVAKARSPHRSGSPA